jgi:dipeptidyl aminopeptidase/acylaminoacyl peptidase
LFHAKDDNNTPIKQTTAFADALKKTNSQVTMISVATGGHYDSMINEGLPKGIHWLKKLTK